MSIYKVYFIYNGMPDYAFTEAQSAIEATANILKRFNITSVSAIVHVPMTH